MSTQHPDRPIDPTYPAARSLPLRYHRSPHISLERSTLERVSIGEGARIVPLLEHRGVPVFVLDETSLMETGTFEALVAAIALGHCLELGYRKVIFSSGGNLGVALSAYAKKVGVASLSFSPLDNAPHLQGDAYSNGSQRLVGVADAQRTRDMVLALRDRVRGPLGYDPLIPHMDWRWEALRCRGLFIAESIAEMGLEFTAIAQTISAGFGPLAMFDVLAAGSAAGPPGPLPRFVGVQQEANCYMYQRWSGTELPYTSKLIVPTLFDRNPDHTFGTYPLVANLLDDTGGELLTVNHEELDRLVTDDVLAQLREQGIRHTPGDDGPLARSGLMALAGMLKAIERGGLTDGPVLVCLCDGMAPRSTPARVAHVVECESDLDALAVEFLKEA